MADIQERMCCVSAQALARKKKHARTHTSFTQFPNDG